MKGSAYEREVCKDLSLWWSYGQNPRVFARTRGSGSALKIGGSKWEGGDIGFVDPEGEPLIRVWNIEAKTGYAKKSKLTSGRIRESNWCALDIIDSSLKEPTLLAMWLQCERDALITGREPVLIFRRYRRKSSIAITSTFYGALIETFNRPNKNVPILKIYVGDWFESTSTLVFLSLTDFFEWIPDIRPHYDLKPRLFIP